MQITFGDITPPTVDNNAVIIADRTNPTRVDGTPRGYRGGRRGQKSRHPVRGTPPLLRTPSPNQRGFDAQGFAEWLEERRAGGQATDRLRADVGSTEQLARELTPLEGEVRTPDEEQRGRRMARADARMLARVGSTRQVRRGGTQHPARAQREWQRTWASTGFSHLVAGLIGYSRSELRRNRQLQHPVAFTPRMPTPPAPQPPPPPPPQGDPADHPLAKRAAQCKA